MHRLFAPIRLGLIVFIARFLTVLSGRRVGIACTKGIFFLLVREALRFGTEKNFRQWLHHSRPQVRALGLTCLCLCRPPDLEATVSPLLSDSAKVKVRPFACVVAEQSLSQLAKRLDSNPGYFGHRPQPQT
jgi:hypothetical protein